MPLEYPMLHKFLHIDIQLKINFIYHLSDKQMKGQLMKNGCAEDINNQLGEKAKQTFYW